MKNQPVPPYFDPILRGLVDQDATTQASFGRHVHWGYWPEPEQADGSPQNFGEAAEELCNVVCDVAGIQNGMRVIDVGCGFGGTMASLNERFSNLKMVGINIDPQQLARAVELVEVQNENSIKFVEADAKCIPCSDKSFDVVLSVESIFHFDRAKFFGEAKRLLTEGGQFTISDFLMSERASQYMQGFDLFGQADIQHAYGTVDLSYSLSHYHDLAETNGLVLQEAIDITKQTMPTYDFIMSASQELPKSWQNPSFLKATRMLHKASRQGLVSYQILKFGNAD